MSDIVNYLINLGFSLFGCNTVICVKGILTTGILEYGAQFNDDSHPILIELADIPSKGGDRRKLEKEKEGFDTDAYFPPSSSSITSYTCSGQRDFEEGWVFTHLPTSVDTYPYRPTGPVPMDISD
ncbi:hypothetical protein FRACYDRAFT_235420 [Fragilariopsis cylindrus CCMP1102]|uniref:Uncharacterized protein n=1 Tax=Fragilariopsis cylindrus CCMP1102 TaxID=635003 RepID=A0A1E7FMI0_9STRA|nr:hypothetical protein FRACYDRAFT_235420 [Fragilariopsis cylindrus CCMP1102]|eukprot:OEU19370.1 hypothetical protein FRACYDRAFT_235420 [Fragilariopsis cylindrus CCMP1102]